MIAQQGTLDISRSRLRHNLSLLQQRVGPAKLCAVVKADSYGHGTKVILEALPGLGVEWVCVYSLHEAIHLASWEMNTLVLSPVVITPKMAVAENFREIFQKKIRLTLTDSVSVAQLSLLAEPFLPLGCRLPVHMQVDTGLTRIGVSPAEAGDLAGIISNSRALKLEGIFAQLSHGDVAGHPSTAEQLHLLKSIAAPLKQQHPRLMVHAQNSGGAWHAGDAGLDMVRLGVSMYGLQPSTGEPIDALLPVARLTAPVLAIHERPAGTGVGYGHTFITRRQSRLAVVPVGYADGYPRLMSGRGIVQVREADMPVVGRVSMDQIVVDVTDLPDVQVGESVTVISWDPAKANSLDRMADAIGTIGYELATHLGSRLKRVVVE